jgi:hypothetical protein
MPRRHYRSVEELRGAVAVAMERLREGVGQRCRKVYALALSPRNGPCEGPGSRGRGGPSGEGPSLRPWPGTAPTWSGRDGLEGRAAASASFLGAGSL